MLNWLRKTWVLLAVIIAAMLIFGDAAQLALTVYNLAAISLVLLVTDFLLDNRDRWGIFPSLDLDEAIDFAIFGDDESPRSPLAAALVVLGAIALLIAILFLSVPSAHGAAIPDRARPLLPVLSSTVAKQWPTAPAPENMAGQVEQESGWKERATLHTSRELGRGLVQLTIAYRADGSERFNAYRDAVRAKALRTWDWQRDPYNARYQLTYLVLTDRSNYVQMIRLRFVDAPETWRAALVCYNAGVGRVLSRRAEAKRKGIAADRWCGGLELAHSRGENAVLYGRPLWQAVNEYPRVIFTRAAKYRGHV